MYHFGQFLIKQISSAFLLLSLLKPFLTLNLLLFYCNCFSPCLIYIVKARLALFVYSDFLLTFSLCNYALIFTFSINFLEFFKNNLKSKHKTECDISLQQQLLSLFFNVISKLIKMASCARIAGEDNVRNLMQAWVMVRLPFIANRCIQMLQGWVAGVSEDIVTRETSRE